ncbi:MAG: hypothetical protein AAF449_00545 [Myxococcota bacterium]
MFGVCLLLGCGGENSDISFENTTYSSLGDFSCTEDEMRTISTLFPDHGFLAAAPILRPARRFTVTRVRYWASDGGTCDPRLPHEVALFTTAGTSDIVIDSRMVANSGSSGRPTEIELPDPITVEPNQTLIVYVAGAGTETSKMCIGTCPYPPPGIAETSLFITDIDEGRSESRFLNEVRTPQGFRFEVDGYEESRAKMSSARAALKSNAIE